MNILAIDLGTDTGYAFGGATITSAGTWSLGSATEIRRWGKERLTRRIDPRMARLKAHLSDLVWMEKAWPDVVVFEDVQFSSYTLQVQLWASFRATLWNFLGAHVRVFECVPVATLKKFATGNGAATKEDMAAAWGRCAMRTPGDPLNDDGVDAAWLWTWGKLKLGRTKL